MPRAEDRENQRSSHRSNNSRLRRAGRKYDKQGSPKRKELAEHLQKIDPEKQGSTSVVPPQKENEISTVAVPSQKETEEG
ncbi:hypothetical protein TKK_0000345 [Trichogramma kaykai]